MGRIQSNRKRKSVATPRGAATRAKATSPPKKKRTSRVTTSGATSETPVRYVQAAAPAIEGAVRVVTPSTAVDIAVSNARARKPSPSARRALLQASQRTGAAVVPATPSSVASASFSEPAAKRKLIMPKPAPLNVRTAYALVRKVSGSVGGNGSFGAIYGELTMGSMQKMIDLMKTHTTFDSSSRFIDVGSGLGKPSIHVAQDPGVEFSYGIEMERSRWMLGMSNLRAIVDAACEQEASRRTVKAEEQLGCRCFFDHGNVKFAKTFDPFTHVYMFSIGFPPELWVDLSKIFNSSQSEYLICFHPPRVIVDDYAFDVELLAQTPTSMHGSSEGHMGYIYKRAQNKPASNQVNCDPLFRGAYNIVSGSLQLLREKVYETMEEQSKEGRLTRSRGVQLCIDAEPEQANEEEG